MKRPEITPEEIKIAVEQPDLMNVYCNDHAFYYKEIEGKGKLLVFAIREDDHFDIQCADWLVG